MARALVGGFHAFQGASEEVLERIRQREGYGSRVAAEGMGRTNALELAILGKVRPAFLMSACLGPMLIMEHPSLPGPNVHQESSDAARYRCHL
jgi:hypothetical protein